MALGPVLEGLAPRPLSRGRVQVVEEEKGEKEVEEEDVEAVLWRRRSDPLALTDSRCRDSSLPRRHRQQRRQQRRQPDRRRRPTPRQYRRLHRHRFTRPTVS